MENSKLVTEYIDQIWNNRNFEIIDRFIHPEFKDQSLPPIFGNNKEGTIKWIMQTGNSFIHKTNVEHQVTEGNESIIKISMYLTHIGAWRGIEPTGIEIKAGGYRSFRFSDGKIIEHWALIDGQSIESQLLAAKKDK